MCAQVNELLFKKYFGTRPVTPLHNLCQSKPIFTRLDGWLAKGLPVIKALHWKVKSLNVLSLIYNSLQVL